MDEGGRGGDRGRSANLAVAQARRAELVARQARPTGQAGPSGPRPTRPTPMRSRPWPLPGRPPGSRPARATRPRRGRPIRPPARAAGWPSPAGSPTASNPLTARVAVNHLWGRHFGRAIVPTVNDFGRNGQRPSHPALLDWLAAEFMDRGWSMKAIHRLIVTSATYRQDSTPDPADLARDPDNVFLWRWTPRRAEAEVVRDCLFAVAGSLDSTMGGPDIDHQAGLTVPRRSLYFQHAAEKQMEFLQIFDAAGRDRVLPPQGEHPAPAGPGPGQQRPVAAPWPAGSPGPSRRRPAPTPSEFRHGRVRAGALAPPDRAGTRPSASVSSERAPARRVRSLVRAEHHDGLRKAKLPRAIRPYGDAKAWSTCS